MKNLIKKILRKIVRVAFADIASEIKSTRADIASEIKSTRTDIASEIKSTRTDIASEIKSTRTDIKSTRASIISELGWRRKRAKYCLLYYADSSQRALVNSDFIYHVSTIGGNAGDLVLSVATEDVMSKFNGYSNFYNIGNSHPTEDIDLINRSRGVMIGGGGLLWHKPYSQDSSGWQWNCTLETLDKIEVPMFLFGVGWIMRQGDTFSPLFYEFFIKMLEKPNFKWLGLRNQYTMSKVLEFVPEHLHHKISLQPCATLIGGTMYPQFRHQYQQISEITTKKVAIVLGHDQVFGITNNKQVYSSWLNEEEQTAFKENLRKFIIYLSQEQNVEVFLVAHTEWEYNLLKELKLENSKNIFIEKLNYYPPTHVYKFYQQCTAVFGMRLHGILIPAGLEVPTFIMGAHEERVAIPYEWGLEYLSIDVKDSNLFDSLKSRWMYLLDNYNDIKKDLNDLQKKNLQITEDNIKRIKDIFE